MKSKEIFKATRNEQNLPRNLEQIDQVIKEQKRSQNTAGQISSVSGDKTKIKWDLYPLNILQE